MKTSLMLLITVLLSIAGLAFSQSSDSHHVEVRIPNYIGLKIVNSAGKIGYNASVDFDYTIDPSAYFSAVASGDVLEPTSVTEFADLEVVVRGGFWYVLTISTPLSYTGTETGVGLALGDIRVNPGSASGLSADAIRLGGQRRAGWNLRSNWQWVAYDYGSTLGWKSLGFNGTDYILNANGDEEPGEYATIVTYRLFNP